MLGTGTQQDPYIIQDVTDLQNVNNDLTAYYELGNDIDASDTVNWNSGEGFIPIGEWNNEFTGNFDGKGYTISNLYIDNQGSSAGLFGGCINCEIKNIKLRDITCIGYSIGSLSADTTNCLIENCCVDGANLTAEYIGGMFCSLLDNSLARNCYVINTVIDDGGSGGGCSFVFSMNNSTIETSYWSSLTSSAVIDPSSVGNTVAFTNCFYNNFLSVYFNTYAGLTALTDTQMKQQSSYTNWDFTNTWGIDEGNSYPYLLVFPQETNQNVEPTLLTVSYSDFNTDTNILDGDISTYGTSLLSYSTIRFDRSAYSNITKLRVYFGAIEGNVQIFFANSSLVMGNNIGSTNVAGEWIEFDVTDDNMPLIEFAFQNSTESAVQFNAIEVIEGTAPTPTQGTYTYPSAYIFGLTMDRFNEMVEEVGLQKTVSNLIDIDVSLISPPNLSVTQIDGGIRLTWT